MSGSLWSVEVGELAMGAGAVLVWPGGVVEVGAASDGDDARRCHVCGR